MPTLAESVGLDPGLQAEVLAYSREHAGAVDADGRKTRDALVWLSRRGLTDLGTGTAEIGGLAKQGAVISMLASVCVSSAFSLWAHRMAIEYIKRFGSSDLRSGVLPSLLSAAVSGSTAMAGGFLDELGLRPLNVSLDLNASPPVLSGSVPWASNLFDTGYVVIVPAADNEGGRYAVAVSSEMTGVRRGPDLDLLALHATASSSVALDDVAIPPEWILRDSLSHFLQAIRPSFLLLQSALCLGLAEAAIDAAGEELTGVAVSLEPDYADLQRRRRQLTADLAARLRRPPTDHFGAQTIVKTRLEAARLAIDTVALEAKVTGGAGYRRNSDTGRRVREAAFLPIQSPTETQLVWELAR